jgi:hypothetical protein
MNDKNHYIKEIEQQQGRWHQDIYKFRIITEEIGEEEPDRQIKYYQIIEDIVVKEKDVADKLAELKERSDDGWQQIKPEIENLGERLTNAINSARSIIN